MARSKEEIISEMVDSGLFSDAEIRQAVAQTTPQERSMGGRVWDALAVPEQKSREGLQMLAGMVPNPEPRGGLVGDVVRGTPRVLADTMAEAAPGFISRESILTAGALKGGKLAAPALKAIGRGVAKGAESISGLEYKTPGVLLEAAKDAKLLFGEGTKKAGALFEDLMSKGRIRQSFARATGSKELLDDALKAADDGTLTPEEALIARQTLDGIKKTLPRFAFHKMREMFDSVAKTKSAQADAAFSKAVKSDALRMLLPVNKGGGTSIAKSTLGTIAGAAPLAAMSPIVQGTAATAIGAGARLGGRLGSQAVRSGSMAGGLGSALSRRKGKSNGR